MDLVCTAVGASPNEYHGLKRTQNIHTEALACPFSKRNRNDEPACSADREFPSFEDIKQHLYEQHRQQISCPICHSHFPSYTLRDTHLRNQNCHFNVTPTAEGLTEQQVYDMSAVSDRNQSQIDAWFELWDIIFPATDRPASPFCTDKQKDGQS